MPTNKKEGLIFGVSMCLIMVFFMGLLNISIHLGGFNLNSIKTAILNISIHLGGLNLNSLKTAIIAFPVTFIIAFILENVVIGKINHMLLEKFVDKSDSKNAYILI